MFFRFRDALGDYLEGKTPVGVMGGHKLSRTSAEYRKVVLLARELARLGFIVVTGGGPGAMEAANLGAYMMQRTDAEVDEALKILSVGNDKVQFEYLNTEAADKVLERFGLPTHMPSIGVPTSVLSRHTEIFRGVSNMAFISLLATSMDTSLPIDSQHSRPSSSKTPCARRTC